MKTNTNQLPDDKKILDFVIEMMTWPFKSYMSGPSPETGKSGRGEGMEWLFSFSDERRSTSGLNGCVYAPTAREAIHKAMKLRAAQKKAAAILKKAAA